jgi:phospholipase C
MKVNRRHFLSGTVGGAAATLVGSTAGWPVAELFAQNFGLASLPRPEESGIDHIVVVMMENRSFDHFLGWLPNAEGMQAGLTYVDAGRIAHATHALPPDFTGCTHPDPDHSYLGGRVQYDGGAMDGFLRSGKNDDYTIGYYVEADRPFFSALARNYTSLDHSFCSILGPTFPNRFFLHSAQTDRLADLFLPTIMPTIWDSLLTAGVSARYYYSNLPFLVFWGPKYFLNGTTTPSPNIPSFFTDAASGNLPAVSFVDPAFTGFSFPTNDDHPPADIRAGDAFLADAFQAVANGPQWPSTVFIVTYDEWGGFFDHVAPPRAAAPANSIDTDLVNGKALLGFRVPTVVASPFSRGEPDDPKVKGMTFDHTSILKLIEWRFGLDPLTARDASHDIQNLARALNFHTPNATVPDLPHPIAPAQVPCIQPDSPANLAPSVKSAAASNLSDSTNPWPRLRGSGLLKGWHLPQ